MLQEYEAADEALGLSTAFLAAGAAGVVATLWPVDDYSTALLMSRFYESLIETGSRPGHPHGGDPAAALRAAQLWLRALTPEDEETYLDRHPQLKARRSARQARPGATVTALPMPRTRFEVIGPPSSLQGRRPGLLCDSPFRLTISSRSPQCQWQAREFPWGEYSISLRICS